MSVTSRWFRWTRPPSKWSARFEQPGHAPTEYDGPNMMLYASSCERPSKSSAASSRRSPSRACIPFPREPREALAAAARAPRCARCARSRARRALCALRATRRGFQSCAGSWVLLPLRSPTCRSPSARPASAVARQTPRRTPAPRAEVEAAVGDRQDDLVRHEGDALEREVVGGVLHGSSSTRTLPFSRSAVIALLLAFSYVTVGIRMPSQLDVLRHPGARSALGTLPMAHAPFSASLRTARAGRSSFSQVAKRG